MVMDQFVTTYRKDFLWPYVRTFGVRPEPDPLYRLPDSDKVCECHCLEKPKPPSEQPLAVLGPLALKEESWSRQGPMGPLLEPKMYPSKVGAMPESSPTSFYNQPNAFLQKLKEKYPFVYECLRQPAPHDMISRINKDRLRTTYQVDFCKMNEYPSAPYDELLRAANMGGAEPCSEPIHLPGDWYRPGQKGGLSNVYSGNQNVGKGASQGKQNISGYSSQQQSLEKQDEKEEHVPGGDKEAMKKALRPSTIPCPRPPRVGRPTCRPNQSPLGFRPGLLSNKDKFDDSGMIRPKRIPRYESQVSNWDPFKKDAVQMDELVVTWGQMAFRDFSHSHGKYSSGRGK